jgi:hypothetical protein
MRIAGQDEVASHMGGESSQKYARIAGLLYLFVIVAAGFGELFVRNRLVAWGDASATADNILRSETLFRVGLVGEMLTCVCDVAVALILYVLLRPVSKNLALLAAFFRLTFAGVYAVTKLFEVAALVALGGGDSLEAWGRRSCTTWRTCRSECTAWAMGPACCSSVCAASCSAT